MVHCRGSDRVRFRGPTNTATVAVEPTEAAHASSAPEDVTIRVSVSTPAGNCEATRQLTVRQPWVISYAPELTTDRSTPQTVRFVVRHRVLDQFGNSLPTGV